MVEGMGFGASFLASIWEKSLLVGQGQKKIHGKEGLSLEDGFETWESMGKKQESGLELSVSPGTGTHLSAQLSYLPPLRC